MAYVNKIILVGNVGRDPEAKTFQNGNSVANFTLATSKRFTDREGNQREETMWHNIVASGKQVESLTKLVRKGDPLYVEGELALRKYLDNTGAERSVYEVRMDRFQLLKAKDAAPAQQRPAQPSQPAQKPVSKPQSFEPQDDDFPW